MKKVFLRTLCLVLLVITVLLTLVSCGNSKYVELGPYAIRKKEYVYMMGIYKKQLLTALGIDESMLNYKVEAGSSVTIGEYLDQKYMMEFWQTVSVLLYSQALFDDYGLSIPEERLKAIDKNVEFVSNYFGMVSDESFNGLAKQYGFDKKAMKNVYVMQEKQRMVIEYLYGSDYSKVTDEDKKAYYEENYFHFQVLIVNNAYKKVTNSKGEDSYVALSETEKAEKNRIIAELTALFIDEKEPYYGEGEAPEGMYKYLIIDPTKSYEELWAKYSEDTLYPGGYYMQNPTSYQLLNPNTYTTAYILHLAIENDLPDKKEYGMSDARIGVSAQDAASVGLSGDNPVCGKAFIKILPRGEKPYDNEKNEDFFGDTAAFNQKVAIYAFGKLIINYQENNIFKADYKENKDLLEHTFINVKANELDYYFMYK